MFDKSHYVILENSTARDDKWMFERNCRVVKGFNDAKSAAFHTIERLQWSGYQIMKDRDENGGGFFHEEINTIFLQREERIKVVKMVKVEEMFEDGRGWVSPNYILYNHDDGSHKFILDNIDAKLMVSARGLSFADDMDKLTPEWSEIVRYAFKTIDAKQKTILGPTHESIFYINE